MVNKKVKLAQSIDGYSHTLNKLLDSLKNTNWNRSVNMLTSILLRLSISPLHDPKSVIYFDVNTIDAKVGAYVGCLTDKCLTAQSTSSVEVTSGTIVVLLSEGCENPQSCYPLASTIRTTSHCVIYVYRKEENCNKDGFHNIQYWTEPQNLYQASYGQCEEDGE